VCVGVIVVWLNGCMVSGREMGRGECLCYVLMGLCVEDGFIFNAMLCWLTDSPLK